MNPVVREAILSAVAAAEESVLAAQRRGEIETEPDFTNQLVGAIRVQIDKMDLSELLKIRVLRAQGAGSPEFEFGADICVVLNDSSSDSQASKGVLIQAKRSGRGVHHRGVDDKGELRIEVGRRPRDLTKQIDDMLRVTEQAFLFIYNDNPVAAVPAHRVKSKRGRTMAQLPSRTLRHFIQDFVDCFIGDPLLNAVDDDTLRRQMRRSDARLGVLITTGGS